MIHKYLSSRFRFLFDLLHQNDLELIVIADKEMIRFFTDLVSSNAWLAVFRKHIYLVTDPRYFGDVWATDHRLVRKVVKHPADLIRKQIERAKQRIGLDAATLNSSIGLEAVRARLKTGDISVDLENFISVSDKETMKRFNRAAAITTKIENRLEKLLRSGIREYTLRAEISYLIHAAGCEEAFTPIVSFGENTARIHTEPTRKKLKSEMPVLIDFGVKYMGVSTDITRSFWYGEYPTEEYQNVRKAVKKALKAAENSIKPSVECSVPADIAMQVLTAGHPESSDCLPHALGHGIGYKVHQIPRISGYSDAVFKQGQIITLEPGIYIPDKFGVRIEHDYIVTDTGVTKLI